MSLGVFLAGVRRDASYALRVLRRAPGFAIVAIATLALGIGASTTIFTIVDGVLLRPLRFAEPDRLVMLRPSSGARVSAAYFHEWRRQSRSLEDMAAWHDVRAALKRRGRQVRSMGKTRCQGRHHQERRAAHEAGVSLHRGSPIINRRQGRFDALPSRRAHLRNGSGHHDVVALVRFEHDVLRAPMRPSVRPSGRLG